MKKFLFTILGMALALGAVAEPAHPEPYVAHNADGTTVTISLYGDEFYHFNTTSDGYTVLRNNEGNYVYADKLDGKLVPTSTQAHDEAFRSANERALLATLTKRMTDKESVTRSKQARSRRDTRMRAERSFDPSSFRGLVILVNFNDRKFSRSDANSFFTRLLNEKNYNGYRNEDGSWTYFGSNFTGSVSDYFSDNTMGVFTPQFDVVGPIDVDASCRQDDSTGSFSEVFKQVVKLADDQIDYSLYDNDNDGAIDLIYFIAAGFGSSYSGNDSQYLWPHAYYLWGEGVEPLDGVWPARYACSVEFYGWEDENYGYTHDGIGTICHEFSHCLGLPDLYDTDYEEGGGQSHVPGKWDVMSGGGHLNYSRCPAGYSLYDRYATGFATPTVISETGEYTLPALGTSNQGYILLTPNENEKFLLENRQRSNKWDAYLPGSGMIVARMDSTNAMVWWSNSVNNDPRHNYYQLVRAGNGSGDSDSDPFPGSKNVTTLYGNDNGNPNLLTWDQQANDFALTNIAMNGGVVSFTIENSEPPKSLIEDFEEMPLGETTNENHVQGKFCQWTFAASKVTAPGSDLCNGEHGVEMVAPSRIETSSPLPYDIYRVTYTVCNNSSSQAAFLLQYSTDLGETWNTVPDGRTTIKAKETKKIIHQVSFDEPVMFRIAQSGGSKTKATYLDDIILYYRDMFEINIPGDVNGDGVVSGADVTALYNVLLDGATASGNADVNNDGVVSGADVTALYNLLLTQ